MMAPYAIAHMKLGLKLWDTGYRFASDARLRVHLTNALEPARDFATEFAFIGDAMANEAQDANAAKKTYFTAVIGNPPYKGHSANPSRYTPGKMKGKLTPAGQLIAHYFTIDGQPLGEKNSKWVNNDYVKFLAFAEKRINDSGVGVIGYITSNSWLDSPTFRGVRSGLLETFPTLWIVDCHGNVNKREVAADGSRDKGVFEIEEGANVTVGLRGLAGKGVRHSDLLGTFEYKIRWCDASNLVAHVTNTLEPSLPMRLLVPSDSDAADGYHGFPSWETRSR